MIKFPYGNSDFYKIITEDYCYLDRTDRIPLLEAMGDSLLFLRPRRFGKSLLLTMLENYYDIAKAAEFERLFGALAVGRDPTPLHNQYLVMRWDFSIVTPKPTYEGQERVLTSYLNVEITNFVSKYAALLPTKVEIDEQNATASFWSLLHAVHQSDHKLYLLIDEYDNFANEVQVCEVKHSRYGCAYGSAQNTGRVDGATPGASRNCPGSEARARLQCCAHDPLWSTLETAYLCGGRDWF